MANTVTRVANPDVAATLYISTGNSVGSNFKQTPTYDSSPVVAQVQPMSSGDVRQMESLNIQGAEKIVFLNGTALAINRIKKFGGDILVFADGVLPEGNVWLIVASMGQWSETWCKVAVALQDDTVAPS